MTRTLMAQRPNKYFSGYFPFGKWHQCQTSFLTRASTNNALVSYATTHADDEFTKWLLQKQSMTGGIYL